LAPRRSGAADPEAMISRPTFAARLPTVLLCLSLAGCATTQAAPSPADPWERVNRSTYAFNDGLDRAVLKPVAKGYRRYVPQPVRTGVTNFLTNLAYPTTIVNDLLQLKFMDAVSDTTRFVVNSTFGLGGLLDPATKANLPRNNEDFGQTLGRWGVPSGPYLVIPFLGPSTLRDTPALYADYLTDGRHYISDNNIGFAFAGLSIVDRRARLIPAEQALEGAFDRYALLRNAFLDRRLYQVLDGNIREDEAGDASWYDEPVTDDPAAPAPGG
jgi:phospholipid-binding lipoprotein MlaA